MRFRDLLGDGRIALNWKRDSARRSVLSSRLFDNFSASCDKRNFVIGRKTQRESRAETGPNAYDRRCTFSAVRRHHVTPLLVYF